MVLVNFVNNLNLRRLFCQKVSNKTAFFKPPLAGGGVLR